MYACSICWAPLNAVHNKLEQIWDLEIGILPYYVLFIRGWTKTNLPSVQSLAPCLWTPQPLAHFHRFLSWNSDTPTYEQPGNELAQLTSGLCRSDSRCCWHLTVSFHAYHRTDDSCKWVAKRGKHPTDFTVGRVSRFQWKHFYHGLLQFLIPIYTVSKISTLKITCPTFVFGRWMFPSTIHSAFSLLVMHTPHNDCANQTLAISLHFYEKYQLKTTQTAPFLKIGGIPWWLKVGSTKVSRIRPHASTSVLCTRFTCQQPKQTKSP